MSLSVKVKEVTKKYGDFVALQPTTIDIENGEFFTILGPSGSGKTTLLKTISGFEIPTSGQVFIGDKDVTVAPPHKRNIGMVFQNYALFPHMTVFDNVAFPLKMRKLDKKTIEAKVNEMLDLVHLSNFKKRFPSQLSGGQRQRVALARALVFDPPVLLLDEPLGALDKQLRIQMQLEIKRIQESLNITTISVTHDQEEALTMSSRICIVKDGSIQQVGTPREIYESPSSLFVADFIGEINLIEGEVVGWEDSVAIIKTSNGEIIKSISNNKNLKNVSFAIRPELIQTVSNINASANVFKGTIQETVYLGESIRCKVETEKGEIITIKISSKEFPFINNGQELYFGWEINEGTILDAVK